MGAHMKTTIELSDSILLEAKQFAKERSITLRSLIEESLAETLARPRKNISVRPVTVSGGGLSHDFKSASWDQIRAVIGS
jgi:hypothetical protein